VRELPATAVTRKKSFDYAVKGIAMIDLRSMAVQCRRWWASEPDAISRSMTMVDVPSQRAPSGARGHLVVLTKRAAEAALPSLLGMGMDYSPTFDRHDGTVQGGGDHASGDCGRNVELGGYLLREIFLRSWKRCEIGKQRRSAEHRVLPERFAESKTLHGVARYWERIPQMEGLRSSLRAAAGQILNLAEALCAENKPEQAGTIDVDDTGRDCDRVRSQRLGMSYEVTGVQLADARARVWMLEKVTFTGAAIFGGTKRLTGIRGLSLSELECGTEKDDRRGR